MEHLNESCASEAKRRENESENEIQPHAQSHFSRLSRRIVSSIGESTVVSARVPWQPPSHVRLVKIRRSDG